MQRVMDLLTEHKQKLINLAEALLEHEVLETEEILKAVGGEPLTDTRKSRSYLKKHSEAAVVSPGAPTGVPPVVPPVAPEAEPVAQTPSSDEPPAPPTPPAHKGGRFDSTV